jgi:hypothetical protein
VVERTLFVLPVLLVLSGCAEAIFSESDEGATRELSQGSSFTVSLPAGEAPGPGEPKIEGTFIRYLGRSLDADGRWGMYRFSAEGIGEAVIRIPRAQSPANATPEFVLRILIYRPRETPPQAGVSSRSY